MNVLENLELGSILPRLRKNGKGMAKVFDLFPGLEGQADGQTFERGEQQCWPSAGP
jgi:ABC-type branched-subunit amino acid transport system ATPase component